jgi:hypothetical protein
MPMQTFFPAPMVEAGSAPVRRALLEDGSLAVRAHPAVWHALAGWFPRIPAREPVEAEVRAWIDVEAGAPSFAEPAGAEALEMGGVRGWIREDGQVLLLGAEGRIGAVIRPAERHARVRLHLPPGADVPALPILSLMTLASSLLLGRLCHTLVHAGAIQGPDGRAWMFIGGTFSGKSTTCVTLIRGGWNYLSDDHVVLGRDAAGAPRVQAWPRRFNLDDGYAHGSSRGVRSRVDAGAHGPGGRALAHAAPEPLAVRGLRLGGGRAESAAERGRASGISTAVGTGLLRRLGPSAAGARAADGARRGLTRGLARDTHEGNRRCTSPPHRFTPSGNHDD